MKHKILVKTHNVTELQYHVAKFLNRPRAEIRGILLVHGMTGLGKTWAIEEMAFSSGALFYRCKDTDKPKDFLLELYRRLTLKTLGAEQAWQGTKAQLESACLSILTDNPNITIYIDEINIPLHNREFGILEIIRDFADLTFASFVLCGEADTKQRLDRYNHHFFDRCHTFYEFTKNTEKDMRLLCDQVSDIKINDDVIPYMMQKTGGNFRKALKMIDEFEHIARQKQVSEIFRKDVREKAE